MLCFRGQHQTGFNSRKVNTKRDSIPEKSILNGIQFPKGQSQTGFSAQICGVPRKKARTITLPSFTHGCMVAACRPGGRKTVPLALKLWSSRSPGFRGENIRVMTYARIRNMASLVLASAYFATAWIGRNIKREVLAEHLARLGKRLGEVPEFAAYAIADGIKRAFTRFGKWVRTTTDAIAKAPDVPAFQLLPGFAELLDIDDG